MQKIPCLPKKIDKKRGFALISTLSVVVLLAFIAVGILSLSAISIRRGANSKATEQAKVNAKLGLMEALNELQKTMGPDQRISAYANVVSNTYVPGVIHPNTLGVWNGWQIPNSIATVPSYGTAKTTVVANVDPLNGGFVKWLSSGNASNVLATPTAPLVNPIQLVGINTAGPVVTQHVSASRVGLDVNVNGVNDGSYAWHVFDESQKINLKTKNASRVDDLANVSSLNSGGKPDYTYDMNYASLSTLTDEDAVKVTELDSIRLAVPAFNHLLSNPFYTLTTHSKGVLANVASGGLQKDLSLLFANDTLPAPYDNNHIYSDNATPAVNTPQRFDGDDADNYVHPLPNPDPKWELLHSHYRLYRDVDATNNEFSIPLGNTTTNSAASVTPAYHYGNDFSLLDNPVKNVNPKFEDNQQILPVVSNAQFIYSIASHYEKSNNRVNAVVVTDVVLTLWNPYSVEIDFQEMELEFYRFPASFSFFRTDKNTGVQTELSPGDYFHVSNMHHPNNIAGVSQSAPWTLRDAVPYRVRVQGAKLAPGEFRVFGVADYNDNLYNPPHNDFPIANHTANNLTHGMVLENDFNELEGGSYASAVMWKDDRSPGQEHGWIYGDIGDKISLAAKSRMVTNGYGGFKDLNGEDASAFIKIYMGDGGDLAPIDTNNFDTALEELYDNGNRVPIGTIVLNSDNLDIVMPEIPVSDTPEHEMGNNVFGDWAALLRSKTPMVIASLRLKTEKSSADIGSAPKSRMWLNNGITNSYFSNGFDDDQNIDEKNLQYEMTWETMTDWTSIPAVEINEGKGYGGSGVNSQNGVHQAVVSQVPLAPYGSIAQFSHAPLNKSGVAPLTSQVVGNSFASTSLSRTTSISPYLKLSTSYIDHSYMANNTLFDGYFLSTAYDETDVPLKVTSPRGLNTVLTDFFTGVSPLRNPNFESTVTADPALTSANYDRTAAYIYNKGAFNVNSTSIPAWTLFLSNASQDRLPIFDVLANKTFLTDSSSGDDNTIAFSRFSPMHGNAYNRANVTSANHADRWKGVSRRLSTAEITTLATNIVAEVQARGPFQSLSEFINRRLENSPLADQGAIQTAIDNSNLNPTSNWQEIAPINKAETDTSARSGYTSDGSLTYLTQADILNRIAPSLTVRGDTFTIRAYGESLGESQGNVKGQAWCEAVVQRTQGYVDPANAPEAPTASLNAINLKLGRKFKIVSFRWLSQNEI